MGARLVAYALQLLDEALAATWIGIAAVHEAVYKGLVGHTILLSDLHQFKQVVQARVHTAVRAQTHDMQLLALGLSSLVSRPDLGVLHDRVVANRSVDLHQVLVYYAAGTYIQVTYLRVTHLTVRQTYVLAAGLQLRMRVFCQQCVPVGRRGYADDVGLALVANAPAIQNH